MRSFVQNSKAPPPTTVRTSGSALASSAHGCEVGSARRPAGRSLEPDSRDARQDAIRSPGLPLGTSIRSELSSALGFDFGQVRVHSDEVAGRAAAVMDASAYTTANQMFFGASQYRPESAEGKRLVAHEAFHVAHQRFSGGLRPGVAPPDSPGERMADKFASDFLSDQATLRGWATPAGGNSFDSAWEIHPQRISTRGTEVHRGDVGAAPVIGQVSVRTGEEVEFSPTSRIPNLIALEYSGALAADSRWLQFVWFELTATTPSGLARVSGSVPTTSGTKPFTTTPATPSWTVDSGSTTDPFYEATGVNIRTSSSTTLFDAPGGRSVASLASSVFSSVPAATSVRFTAHFQTYLIQGGAAAYVVGYSASTAFTPGASGARASAIGYTVSGSGPVTGLPSNLLTIFIGSYPGPWAVS